MAAYCSCVQAKTVIRSNIVAAVVYLTCGEDINKKLSDQN